MPLTVPSSGSSGAATPRGDWTPQFQNIKAAAYDVANFSGGASSSAGAAGYLQMVKVPVEHTGAIANLHFYVFSAGATLTAGQCKGFIYNEAGTLLAQTADLATVLTSTGFKTLALTAESGQSLTDIGGANDWVHCGLLANGTTPPSILGLTAVNTGSAMHWGYAGLVAYRFFRTGAAGYTSVPASRPAVGSLSEDTGRQWWMGLS